MIAASAARKSYFDRFPRGALPNWLAFPKTARMASHYDAGGRPLLNSNPVARPSAASLAQAKRLYEGFTGVAPRTLRKINLPPLPETGLAIGKVFGIMYTVDATGERLHHEFKGKARPTLIAASDGTQVFLRGGAYTFTKRGFVDKP